MQAKHINKAFLLFLSLFLTFSLFIQKGKAQTNAAPVIQQQWQAGQDITFDVRVAQVTELVSGKYRLTLWGIDKFEEAATVFNLKARADLEKKIGNAPVTCTIKIPHPTKPHVQCVNQNEEDLSLYLLQKGYASADREEIYGSIYEQPYLQAERVAQNNNNGIWAEGVRSGSGSGSAQGNGFMIGVVLLMVLFLGALGVLSFFIMRGFGRVVDIQNQSIDLATRERSLKDKEKYIIATMLNSEIKENKAKIEAYVTIYEETLHDFDDDMRTPKYKKSGEVIQKQPALSRSVFDGNTNKLDLVGSILASDIIHYYARIKTVPDYVEIATDTPEEEVKALLESVIDNAKKLDEISDKLIEKFSRHGLVKSIEDISPPPLK